MPPILICYTITNSDGKVNEALKPLGKSVTMERNKGGGPMKQDYIAVMDSGLGGLSVLRELRRLLPQER